MSWFPNYHSIYHAELSDAASLAAGRALHICHRFESACKFLLQIGEIENYLSQNREATYEEFQEFFKDYREKWLTRCIEALSEILKMQKNDIEILKTAVDSRNYIAHEATIFFHAQNEWLIIANLKRLRSEVQRLANGARIMFSWENKIEEKELGPWGIFHDYPKMVDEWVFGHVKSLLEESENRPELAKTEASLLEEQKTLRKKRPLKQSNCKKW